MKKAKLILITLVLSFALLGAGYAYWTDSLTISNTVGTGSFDINLGCISDAEDYDNYCEAGEKGNPFGTGDDYVNPNNEDDTVTLKVSKNKITFTNENLYPGSGAHFSFKISNDGTVPAKLLSVDPNITEGEGLKDSFIYTIGAISLFKFQSLPDDSTTIIKKTLHTDYTQYTTFQEFVAALNNKLSTDRNGSKIILQPKESIVMEGDKVGMGYDIFFNPNTVEYTKDTHIETENARFSFDLYFNYTQWNNQ